MLQVVCALIHDGNHWLIAQRNAQMKHGLKWEFPGGKIEPGEARPTALKRELWEELAIEIEIEEALAPVHHIDSAGSITLYPFICSSSKNHIKLIEHQQTKWVKKEELLHFDFTMADRLLLHRWLAIEETFQPKLIFNLEQSNGASGLVFEKDRLVLIADEAFALNLYDFKTGQQSRLSIGQKPEGSKPLPKHEKPDFEAIAPYESSYFLFGSGSAAHRHHWVELSASTLKRQSSGSLISLYEAMRNCCEMSEEDFNIEGVILQAQQSFFFNRGNGPNKKNGIFKVEGNWQEPDYSVSFFPISLPPLFGGVLGFTDALYHEELFYFTAAAEAGASTYEDGAILGSAIGWVDPLSLKFVSFKLVSYEHKIEGITFWKKEKGENYFLLCEDADGAHQTSKIFSIKLLSFQLRTTPS